MWLTLWSLLWYSSWVQAKRKLPGMKFIVRLCLNDLKGDELSDRNVLLVYLDSWKVDLPSKENKGVGINAT